MPDPASPEIVVRPVVDPDELQACVRLYEETFHLGPGDGSLNTRLLVGIVRNSGLVVGAFAATEMVGFTLSFLARDPGGYLYQYSQLAVVAEGFQGLGIGRRLKLAQRGATLAMGVDQIRWSFDPFLVRNAHFNLSVLRARAVALERDMYGTHGHGLDAPLSTDRLLAVWDLASTAPSDNAGAEETLEVPATASRQLDAARRDERRRLLDAFEGLFDQGYVAVRCDLVDAATARYRFSRVA